MNKSEPRISQEIAPDVFALAAELYAKENQCYSLSELMQAGAEVQIPPELIQQALQQLKAKQIQAEERKKKLKLILTSGIGGVALAFCGFGVYNTLANNFTLAKRPPEAKLEKAQIQPNRQMAFEPLPPPEAGETTFTGQVQQYLLNPEGKVDGVLLSNGLQVKFGPHMGDSLVAMIAPGVGVSVSGTPGVSTRFGQEVKAKSITNSQTNQTLVKQPPAVPPQPPLQSNYSNLSVEGTAQQWLVGHRGEINGVILSSGAQVKFPPHVGMQLLSLAKAGDKVQAEGFGTSNSYGQVLQATGLRVDGQSVSFDPPNPNLPPVNNLN
ncbi:hypothetical protein QUA56_17460 [Microcoleus sp. N3A4]|uniref:hypothetical protein n=1 Tax=Microcoleus sp. N3A4 TaxID=3055379 RepID=UPI002FD6BF7F